MAEKKKLVLIRALEDKIRDETDIQQSLSSIIEFTEDPSPKIIHAALHALGRLFSSLILKGELQRSKGGNATPAEDDVAIEQTWLREKYISYLNRLCILLGHEEPGLQIPSLNILLDLLKNESMYFTHVSRSHQFSNNHFYRVVESLIDNDNFSEPLKKEFSEKYWNLYDDLRYYFLKDAAKIINFAVNSGRNTGKSGPNSKRWKLAGELSGKKLNRIMENTFEILDSLRTMPTEESEIDKFWTAHPLSALTKQSEAADDLYDQQNHDNVSKKEGKIPKKSSTNHHRLPILLQLNEHKRVFSECWLAVLNLPMTTDSYKKILLIMHKKIIPHMLNPPLLLDFLTESYNAGGVVSILALNGLFTLIHEHNLDYPDFYIKLYGLFDRNLMHVKYRSRFFRLADLFLASTHLPVQLVAAFIKRMSRLSLTSPPHGIVILIPMIYNLIKRHPSCMVLIHCTKENSPKDDEYDYNESDPMKSGALNSSLWELKTLQEHYYPNVATLAKIFEEQFSKPSYNLEDFLDHTYATIFSSEVARKPRKNKTPALAFQKPDFLFPTQLDNDLQEGKDAPEVYALIFRRISSNCGDEFF
ncbi:hypothetical protein G9A89_001997 [Geosiphon pyriformis]|nr:hypothetical protein G9A89_001997 [Geosiphon pyriformis]